MKDQIKQIQTKVGVLADGDFGPITAKAVAAALKIAIPSVDFKTLKKQIQTAAGVEADGDIGPITVAALLTKLKIPSVQPNPKIGDLIKVAETQVGIFETSKNHGVGIEKYWASTNYKEGYKNREPYCAAALCWIIDQTDLFTDSERPKTAAAFGFENWADNLPKKTKITRKPTKVKRGDLVIFSFSHIGLATSDSDSKGNFSTIEANTNPAGSRDGNGVYKKTRNISSLRSTVTIL